MQSLITTDRPCVNDAQLLIRPENCLLEDLNTEELINHRRTGQTPVHSEQVHRRE